MNTEAVKCYNRNQGFGFIIKDETQSAVFVQASGLEEDIEKNDKVSYEITEVKKGLNVISVRKV
ncbi:MAG: CspA family cold shock protein [Marivirga sp.]|jgi:CspA family cold shock protein